MLVDSSKMLVDSSKMLVDSSKMLVVEQNVSSSKLLVGAEFVWVGWWWISL